MAFPNVTDIVATTIESRREKIRDNVTKNNALFMRLKERGNIEEVSGGSLIFEELNFAENGNAAWYSGYDQLSVAAQDVLSASQFQFKQAACPVVISGLEMLQNSGEEAKIDLLNGRIKTAEGTMANLLSSGLYSDGTGFGGKQLTGLGLAISTTPTSGVYGGIDPSTAVGAFWANQKYQPGALTATTIQPAFNTLWAQTIRGKNRVDLILLDNNLWSTFLASLQAIQRFTEAKVGSLGFPSIDYIGADVVLDGGIGGFMPQNTGFFIDSEFLHFRPHKDRNMVSLTPNRRVAVNQDAEVEILAWAGNLTCSGRRFQGILMAY